LYPVGVSGELLTYWTSLEYVGRTKMWSIEMPNKLNISFSLWTAIFLIMLAYIPCMFFFIFIDLKEILAIVMLNIIYNTI